MATSTATAAHAFKAAMVAAMRALVDEGTCLVTFGHPGASVSNFPDAVAFTRIDSVQDPATLGTNRAREETLTLVAQISCWRPGEADDATASDAAYGLLEVLERHVRVTDTTIGGTVRQCFLESHSSEGATDPDVLVRGRMIEIEATFVAVTRITG